MCVNYTGGHRHKVYNISLVNFSVSPPIMAKNILMPSPLPPRIWSIPKLSVIVEFTGAKLVQLVTIINLAILCTEMTTCHFSMNNQ